MHKLAVSEVMLACSSVDAQNPETPKLALTAPTVAIGKAPRAVCRLFHESIKFALVEEIAFGAADSAALDSWHGFLLSLGINRGGMLTGAARFIARLGTVGTPRQLSRRHPAVGLPAP